MNSQNTNQITTLPQDYQQLLEKLKEKKSPQNGNNDLLAIDAGKIISQPIEEVSTEETPIKEAPAEEPIIQPLGQLISEPDEKTKEDSNRQTNEQKEESSFQLEESEIPAKIESIYPQNLEVPDDKEEEKIASAQVLENFERKQKALDTTTSTQARQLTERLTEDLKRIEELTQNKEILEKELQALEGKYQNIKNEIENSQKEVSNLTEEINKLIKGS